MLCWLLSLFLVVGMPLMQAEPSPADTSSSSSSSSSSSAAGASCNTQIASLSSTNQKLEAKIDQLTKEVYAIRKDFEKVTQSLDKIHEYNQQESLWTFAREKVNNGMHTAHILLGSLGIHSLETLVDPDFYRAWCDILAERVEFIKYAVPNRVIPTIKADVAKLTHFAHSRSSYVIDAIYSHSLYGQVKKEITSHLGQMNVESRHHDMIMNGIVALGFLIVLVLAYSILSCFCGCLCPRVPIVPSLGSTSVSTSQTSKTTVTKNKKGSKKKGSASSSSSSSSTSVSASSVSSKDQSQEQSNE